MTGVLPVALSSATKVLGNIIHSSKTYVCVMQLHSPVPEEDLRRVLNMLQGEIYQRPPLRSSVKRAVRVKKVNKIELLEYTGKYALLIIDSEAGTYMRKICHDAGLLLGVGAHMRELRRIRTGPFTEDKKLFRLQEISEALYQLREEGSDELLRNIILPVEVSVCHIPKILVRDSAVDSIAHGADLAVPGIAAYQPFRKGDTVALLTLKGELVGLGNALVDSDKLGSMEKGLVVKSRRVVMKPGVYPSVWKKKEPGSNN
ncbi:MAG: RNA-guided pseudouridylation complex pseudouridine synthase subunit Cbf5 [Desulfurococcales archaeon]|nr:RNA-guided pseudouridylation complex pseudouridine synthase subunit Cbf5 [Desulfurococcales archaeon]